MKTYNTLGKKIKNTVLKTMLAMLMISGLSMCAKETKSDVMVYENDFETGDLTDITGGAIDTYQGTKVLGRYNDGGFTLNLKNLPAHELVEISFDLYIHDTWDGNRIGDANTTIGPDIWNMKVDGTDFIYTTFSNADCGTGNCLPQSYPYTFRNDNNNPGTGAYRKDLPGVCAFAGVVGGTSLYKIVKRVRHSKAALALQCLDKLIDTYTTDPLCSESWSVDNIKVRAINL